MDGESDEPQTTQMEPTAAARRQIFTTIGNLIVQLGQLIPAVSDQTTPVSVPMRTQNQPHEIEFIQKKTLKDLRATCKICSVEFFAKEMERHAYGEFQCFSCKQLFFHMCSLQTHMESQHNAVQFTEPIRQVAHEIFFEKNGKSAEKHVAANTNFQSKSMCLDLKKVRHNVGRYEEQNSNQKEGEQNSSPDLILHVKKRKNSTNGKETRPFSCLICGLTYKTLSSRNQHQLLHGPKTVKCSSCAYECHLKSQLNKHNKANHSK